MDNIFMKWFSPKKKKSLNLVSAHPPPFWGGPRDGRGYVAILQIGTSMYTQKSQPAFSLHFPSLHPHPHLNETSPRKIVGSRSGWVNVQTA